MERCLQQTTIDVGEKLFTSFKRELQKLTYDNNHIKCCKAMYQADATMAGRMMSGATDLIFTSDSDQAALLGDRCICVKKFKFKGGKKATLESFDIFTASETTLNEILLSINLPIESEKIIQPKYPLFNNIGCIRLRGLIAVGIGCDVSLNPITTPKTLLSFLQSEMIQDVSYDDAYFALKKFL
jgi:hypothetical protein